MATEASRGSKLTTDEKAATRLAVDKYKREHVGANLKEILQHLDVPWKDKLTEGVLRGLSARRAPANGAGRGGRRAAADTRPAADSQAVGGGRARAGRRSGRTLERMTTELTDLRRRRDALDGQIDGLEGEVRDRLRESLGSEAAGRILGGLLDRVGDVAGRVGSAVGDKFSEVTGRSAGNS